VSAPPPPPPVQPPFDPLPKAVPTGGPEYYQARYDDFKRRHPDKEPPDYYLGYGKKYATRFLEQTNAKLSTEGQAWLLRTRENLQQAIEQKRAMDPVAFDQLEQDNNAFKRFAYDSHPKAYIDAGLLKLPAGDLYNVSMTPDVGDLLSKDGVKQVIDVMKQTGLKDIWNVTTATGAQVGRGVAGAVESTTKAIADWWNR
jgi:hypothetical protein